MRDKQTRDNKDFDTIFSNWRYISIVSFVFSPVQWDGQNLTLRNLVLEANALNQWVHIQQAISVAFSVLCLH